MASVDHADPGVEGVTQGASRAEDDEETPAWDAQCTGGERKRQQRNGRREQSGKKDREEGMMMDPSKGAAKETRRHVAPQRRFAATAADVPGGLSAQDAASDGAEGQQPGVSSV